MNYKTMEELLRLITDRPLARKLAEIHQSHLARFQQAQGSQHNHQAWQGGYLDHVTDTMNIARILYVSLGTQRKLPFSLSDALSVLFLHDIEKSYPERVNLEALFGMTRAKAKDRVRYGLLHELKIWEFLSNAQKNAIDHIEGEKDSYSSNQRVMGPLATFCHLCDVTSARIWFDHPLTEGETWGWRESEDSKERVHADSIRQEAGD